MSGIAFAGYLCVVAGRLYVADPTIGSVKVAVVSLDDFEIKQLVNPPRSEHDVTCAQLSNLNNQLCISWQEDVGDRGRRRSFLYSGM